VNDARCVVEISGGKKKKSLEILYYCNTTVSRPRPQSLQHWNVAITQRKRRAFLSDDHAHLSHLLLSYI